MLLYSIAFFSFVLMMVILFSAIHFIYFVFLALRIIKKEQHQIGFSINRGTPNILVAGDSTMVGIGAKSADQSISGLIARDFKNSSVKNISHVGLRARGLRHLVLKEIEEGHRYDVVLLEIGPNDIVHGTNVRKFKRETEVAFLHCAKLSDNVFYFSGNVGAIPLWPELFRFYFEWKSKIFVSSIKPAMQKYNIQHIDIFHPNRHDPLMQNWKHNFSVDEFHPNENGYQCWYQSIKPELDKIIK